MAVPVLMYHAFARPGEPAGRYRVPIRRFAAQMAFLRVLGFRVVRLSELGRWLREGREPPARSVVVTMDDGYRDNVELALPVLRRNGFGATVFVVTGRVGGVCDWTSEPELAGRPLCDWAEVRALSEGGIEIGAHTRTHPRLTALPAEGAREEIAGSRADLERELGRAVELFSYPYGDCDPAVEALAEEAGFLCSCGVRSGLNGAGAPIQRLYRTEILGTDTLPIFAAKLRSGSSEALGSKRRLKRGRSGPSGPSSTDEAEARATRRDAQ